MKFKRKNEFNHTPAKRQGDKISGLIPKVVFGKPTEIMIKTSFRKHKSLPKGCRTPKRICIICLTNSIHKNDSNYESKICKQCTP